MTLASAPETSTLRILLFLILFVNCTVPLFKMWQDSVKDKRQTRLMEKLIDGITQLSEKFASLSSSIVDALLRKI